MTEVKLHGSGNFLEDIISIPINNGVGPVDPGDFARKMDMNNPWEFQWEEEEV